MSTENLPETMKAISIREPGAPEVLELIETKRPTPLEKQVLIKVAAAGVNRPDIFQRMGNYPPPKGASELPGLEVSGTVVATGYHAKKYQPGDKVCALVPGGGYAEYCLADEGSVLSQPEGISETEAAGLPETVFTVWHNVFQRGNLQPGETLLVHGGSSGIGTTAIQLAKASGANVITTVGSDEKADFCKKLGADHAINYQTDDYPEVVRQITDGKGANVILDMVGGDYIEKNMICAAEDGRIVQIAFLNGPIAEVNFARLMMKRLTLTGSTLRARPEEVKAAIAKEVENRVWPMIKNNKFKPVIDSTYPLADARKAHERMESSQHIGKIILTM